MRYLLYLAPLFLVACNTAPIIQTETKEVKVPVPVPCKVEIPSPPEYAFPNLRPDHDIFVKSKIILADRRRSLAYEDELLTALRSCVNPTDK